MSKMPDLTEDQKQRIEVPDLQDTPVVRIDQNAVIRRHIEAMPVLAKALKLVGPDLGIREREVGNDYDHALNTAIAAYEAGFGKNPDVLLRCILHDYLSPRHLDDPVEVEARKTLLGNFCAENNIDREPLLEDLDSIQKLEGEADLFISSIQVSAVADLFIPQRDKGAEIEQFAQKYSQAAIVVKVCEIIEKFACSTNGKHDLIEDETGIFQDNPERIADLRATARIKDALEVTKFYLPILENIGPAELVSNLKNRTVEQLAPKCFRRVSVLAENLRKTHLDQVNRIFFSLVDLVNGTLQERYPGERTFYVGPFLKSPGSTVIKMLKYGREDFPELGRELSEAQGEAIDVVITSILEKIRDLIRARIIVPERSSKDLGDVLIRSAQNILHRTIVDPQLGFRGQDLKRGEALDIILNKPKLSHTKSLRELMDRTFDGGWKMRSKLNGYQCLHFAIGYMNGSDKPHVVEIQLLTDKMQEHNELGPAAHGKHKINPEKRQEP